MANIRSWLNAHDHFKQARDKYEGRPLGVETQLVVSRKSPTRDWSSDQLVYAIRYHGTEVVRYYPNGNVGIHLNGWDSKTTKARVREYSPGVSIWSSRGETMLTWCGPLEDRHHCLVIPMDTEKEYFITPARSVIMPNGFEVKDWTGRVALPRSATFPAKRISDPPRGGVLVSPEGVHYVVASKNGIKTVLCEYLGDFADDRNWTFLGRRNIEVNELFALTMADWTPGSRFVRSFDN